MEDEQGVKIRINVLLKELHVSENQLSKIGRFSQKVLNNQFSHSAKLQVETVLFLLNEFPNVSADWLMKGEGEMFKDEKGKDAQLLPDYSSMINAVIAAKDETISALKDKVRAKEETIAALNGQLSAKDSLIESLERHIASEYKKEEEDCRITFGVAETGPHNYKHK